MLLFLGSFMIFIVLYHLIVTIFGYGILDGNKIEVITYIKEAIRVIFFLLVALTNFQKIKSYFRIWRKPRALFLLVLFFGIAISYIQGKGIFNMLIGIKYDFHFLLVFLSASFIGYILSFKKFNINKIIYYFQYILIGTVILGFIRQIGKFLNTNFFTKLGYGPIGDFVFGQNPPLYYRTGPLESGGISRRQGLFSGPNNYGYFLAAFFPLIIFRRKPKRNKLKELFKINKQTIINISFIILWILAIILTLSRTALIGGVLGIIIINRKIIKAMSSKLKIGLSLVLLLTVIFLSFIKMGSTLQHISSKISGINNVINHPLGYGLGTAGPAVHHQGTILPENFFIQIMIDIGTLGFILRSFVLMRIIKIKINIQKYFKNNKNSQDNEKIYLIRKYLSIGRACLFIMGLFLHVFEDSMVNYLFFVPYGVLTGYLSNIILDKKNLTDNQ